MHLNPYGRDAVLLAADLANRPPVDAVDLDARCVAAGLVAGRSADDHDVARARDLLRRWVQVVDAPEPDRRAELVNGLLADFCAHPRLTDHSGGWHLHYRPPDLPVSGVLAALVAMGTALHLAGRGMARLARCAVGDCDRVFADVSRTGRQRYCATSCANRDAVRRHRATRR